MTQAPTAHSVTVPTMRPVSSTATSTATSGSETRRAVSAAVVRLQQPDTVTTATGGCMPIYNAPALARRALKRRPRVHEKRGSVLECGVDEGYDRAHVRGRRGTDIVAHSPTSTGLYCPQDRAGTDVQTHIDATKAPLTEVTPVWPWTGLSQPSRAREPSAFPFRISPLFVYKQTHTTTHSTS